MDLYISRQDHRNDCHAKRQIHYLLNHYLLESLWSTSTVVVEELGGSTFSITPTAEASAGGSKDHQVPSSRLKKTLRKSKPHATLTLAQHRPCTP